MSRAAISGVGVVSAFGVGAAAFFDGLAQGRAAVGPIRAFDVTTFPVRVAGEVTDLPANVDVAGRRRSRSQARARPRGSGRGLAQRRLHGDRSGRRAGRRRGPRTGAARGLRPAARRRAHRLGPGAGAALPRVAFRAPIDGTLRALAEALALTGPRIAHVSACAAGALAVAHAAALVERGEHDVVVAGATDSMINPLGLGGMARLGAPSPRHAPDACRPFDRRRDGLVMGEGAAFFVVENEARARARGARVLARIVGWGSTQDGHRVTAPRPDGRSAARAISKALGAGRRSPAEAIGYVNAHGTGTPLNDPAEVRALRLALGAHADRVPVSSIKGAVGHLMAASGAIELAACLLPLARGPLPGTAHHRVPDPGLRRRRDRRDAAARDASNSRSRTRSASAVRTRRCCSREVSPERARAPDRRHRVGLAHTARRRRRRGRPAPRRGGARRRAAHALPERQHRLRLGGRDRRRPCPVAPPPLPAAHGRLRARRRARGCPRAAAGRPRRAPRAVLRLRRSARALERHDAGARPPGAERRARLGARASSPASVLDVAASVEQRPRARGHGARGAGRRPAARRRERRSTGARGRGPRPRLRRARRRDRRRLRHAARARDAGRAREPRRLPEPARLAARRPLRRTLGRLRSG